MTQSPYKNGTTDEKRFLVAIVGNGEMLTPLIRIFERESFISAFPRFKVAGWVPCISGTPVARSENSSVLLRRQVIFPSVQALFEARPGLDMVLDVSDNNQFANQLREYAPSCVTIVGYEAIKRFCTATEEGKIVSMSGAGLRKAHNMFALLVDQISDDVIIVDAKLLILDLNKYASQSRHVARDVAVGMPISEFDPKLFHEESEDFGVLNESVTTGKRIEKVVTELMDKGTIKYMQVFCFPLYNPLGKATEFLYLRRNITERYAMDKSMQHTEKMVAIGELSTILAHEIRNPLFAIGGFTNALLRNPSLDENAREKVRIIYDESRRLDRILATFLNFSRPTVQEIDEFDSEEIAKQTLEFMMLGSSGKNITTSFEIADNLPKVHGNAENLKQCLINIYKNAIEAMPQGGELTLRIVLQETDVLISVSDTGSGIPADLLDQVFNPFFTTKPDGVGLGLAKTRQIIEGMGGQMWLTSQQGEGTTVAILLPVALAL